MKKLITLLFSLSLVAIAYATDYTATVAGNWSEATTWGGAGVPGATDNVNTAGFEITISADAACANLTYANSSAQLAIGDGITLTVNGVINSSVALVAGSNPFSTMHENGIVKLTGAALGSTDVNLIMDQAVNATTANSICTQINNLIIAGSDPAKTYKFGQTNRNYIHGKGYFKIMGGTKIDLENIMQLGSLTNNNFIIEEGATVVVKQNLKGGGGNASKITTITINGMLTCNQGLNATTLTIGENGYFKTLRGKAANDDIAYTGWWSAIGTPGTTATNYGIPTTITIGTNAVVEFAGGATQYLPGVIPGTTTAISYANIVVSGTASKPVQSALSASGTLLNFGTLTGAAVTCPKIVNVSSSDVTKGTVSGTIIGSSVWLMATPLSGNSFVNWTEGGNEVSNAATYSFAASGNKTLVGNFSVSTGINNVENNAFVTVQDHVLLLSKTINSIEVYTLHGQLVKAARNVTSIRVDNQGVYVLKMNTTSGIKVQKVFVN